MSLIGEVKPELIGISVTTPLRKKAVEISLLIKNIYAIPIVWGGPDPTISAQDCLAYCDFVCVGEGEKTIIDIASALDVKDDIKKVNNIAYMAADRCVRNPLNPLVIDLDSLPFKDIDKDNKFLIEDNMLIRNFHEVSNTLNYKYHLIGARGCPYGCSYCCEDFYKKLYDKQVFLRRRSVSHIIQELEEAKIIRYKFVQFEDEVFSYDYDWLLEFKDRYKSEINLPFTCYIYPNKNIERQLKILKETGLTRTCLALQSGSGRINKQIFNRVFDRELFIKTARLLKSMDIEYYVDVITFNPFETEEDLRLTLDVLNELPRPFWLCINKLYVLKGTKIYTLLKDYKKTIKSAIPERLFTYYSLLFWRTTEYHKNLVKFIYAIRIFKYFPALFNYTSKIYSCIRNPRDIPKRIKRKFIKGVRPSDVR